MNPVVSEWVFRHAGGCLIDTPDLPIPAHSVAWRWTATLWPEPLALDGFAALEWEHGQRGWQIPATLAAGDIIEFGITTHDPHGAPIAAATYRWYGWLHHATDLALIVHGPYAHPTDAVVAARPVIDEIRLDQLDPPGGALLSHESNTGRLNVRDRPT
ncbi:MAG: hypothetical protein Q7V57_18455 [Actinomycetota bacterium]|nr:hypothetical protein [Actinomycetota bacterium]